MLRDVGMLGIIDGEHLSVSLQPWYELFYLRLWYIAESDKGTIIVHAYRDMVHRVKLYIRMLILNSGEELFYSNGVRSELSLHDVHLKNYAVKSVDIWKWNLSYY